MNELIGIDTIALEKALNHNIACFQRFLHILDHKITSLALPGLRSGVDTIDGPDELIEVIGVFYRYDFLVLTQL